MKHRSDARLTVVPMGGLGNRMRVIRSAYSLAQSTQCRIEVAFAANSECRCNFGDVFAPIEPRLPNFTVRTATWFDQPPSRYNLHIPLFLRKAVYAKQFACPPDAQSGEIVTALRRNAKAYISTCYEFCESDIPMSLLFKPSRPVESAVEAVVKRFGCRTVGFHVRTTDNVQALKYSPYTLFAAAARWELEQNPHTMLFLATDSPEVKNEFTDEFGERVITSDDELSRSTRHGMLAAATDLFALSHCDKIYGSHYSSFSEIAAELGGKQAEILRLPECPR